MIAWTATLVVIGPIAAGQELYVYPAKGQSDEQLANDRFACHQWAVKESNFDPSKFGEIAPPPVVRVPVPENKAAGATAKGAIAGAIAGAVLGHGDDAKNAVAGAIVGSAVGAAVEQSGQIKAEQEAQTEAQSRAAEIAKSKAEIAVRRSDYRRAMTACLEGRGYTVR